MTCAPPYRPEAIEREARTSDGDVTSLDGSSDTRGVSKGGGKGVGRSE